MKYVGLLLCLMCGCTMFHVHQVDGEPGNQRTTDLRASAWFSSAQHLDKLRASQSDKTQTFGMGAAQQQGATNALEALNAIARIVEALRPAP